MLSRGKFSKLSHCLQLEVQDGQGEPQLHLVEPALKPPAGGEVNGIEVFPEGNSKIRYLFLRLIDMIYNKKVPSSRSETPEEAMESSLLGLVEPSSQIFEEEKHFDLISSCRNPQV